VFLASWTTKESGVPTDLDDLAVLEDQTVGPDAESILELLFPESFYVVGVEGNYLTTMVNLDIFHRVLDLIGEETDLDSPEFREEISAMLQDADQLSQEDYDNHIERDSDDLDEDYEEREKWDE
jgi:hypothetical protein